MCIHRVSRCREPCHLTWCNAWQPRVNVSVLSRSRKPSRHPSGGRCNKGQRQARHKPPFLRSVRALCLRRGSRHPNINRRPSARRNRAAGEGASAAALAKLAGQPSSSTCRETSPHRPVVGGHRSDKTGRTRGYLPQCFRAFALHT